MAAMIVFVRGLLGSQVVEPDDGQTMVEYGLILAGIALVVVTTVFLLGGAIQAQFQSILDQLA